MERVSTVVGYRERMFRKGEKNSVHASGKGEDKDPE